MTYLRTLTDQSNRLIRAEITAAAERERLLQAARQVVMEGVFTVSEVSAATGLTCDDIRAALAMPIPLDDSLAKLAGLR
jgi:hypothetical protein